MRAGELVRRAACLIYPDRCAFCGEIMDYTKTGMYVCGECMDKIKFCIRYNRCAVCGSIVQDAAAFCNDCAAARRIGTKNRCTGVTSVCVYDKDSSPGILRFKLGTASGATETFARLIVSMVESDFKNVRFDFVVSVPPHRKRMHKLGFDQGRALAKRSAVLMGVKYAPGALVRVRRTEKQSTLSRQNRIINLKGAFAAVKAEELRGKTVLVVDDVITTGATVSECARALRTAGAGAVYAASIAKTDIV